MSDAELIAILERSGIVEHSKVVEADPSDWAVLPVPTPEMPQLADAGAAGTSFLMPGTDTSIRMGGPIALTLDLDPRNR